jgi:hypothetical protein
VADNPALAEATGQNWLNLISNYAENYKLVMQSVLDQIGKLKDFYTYRLNVLKAQADMIGSIVDAIMKEEKFNFEKFIKTWDMQIKQFKAYTDASYKSGKLALEKEKLLAKQLQQSGPPIQIKTKEK